MDIQLLRCRYCGRQYHYQFSGEGCFENNKGTKEYCPECTRIINKALDANTTKDRWIPKFVETSDVSWEEIMENEKRSQPKYIACEGKFRRHIYGGNVYYTPCKQIWQYLSEDKSEPEHKVYVKMAYDRLSEQIDGKW